MNHFSLFSGFNFQQWSSSCPSFLQFLQESFSSFLATKFSLFPFHFLLSSFLEDNSLDTPTPIDPGDQILLKIQSAHNQIEQEHRPHRHEPNATRLGSNECQMREISRSIQNDKQAKKMC
jgi:hypothetical protein